ncbi:MAG: pilus assembly protein PilM, partial [Candidatus Pacebacteria bacterium]|nr:pilus assembly protein PilM [Candidatus Paceibacterota bacterium]
MNPLKDIFSKILGATQSGDDSAIGVDIGSSAIKVVEIKKKSGRVMLETYGAIALGPYDNLDPAQVANLSVEKTTEALQEVLKQSGASSGKPAFAIPVQLSLIFTIDLPAQIKESEIGSIVPTEARKYIPLPITEVSLDYFVFPKKEMSFEEMNAATESETNPDPGASAQKEKTSVLVVATQNDAVSKYRTIITGAKMEAAFFEIETFSSIRSNFEHELSPVLLMDFGASRTKLSIVEFGMLKSFHSIERGGADISKSIAQSLNISFSEAEKMKKDLGLFSAGDDNSVK